MYQLITRSAEFPVVLWAATHPGMLQAVLLAISLLVVLLATAFIPGVASACSPASQGSGCGG